MTFLLSLLGFTRTLREWATIALRWALTPLWHVLIVALAASLAWGAIERHGRLKAVKVLASTEQAYRTAQADAKAAQDAADLATAARYSALAKESEHEHQIAVAVVQSAADRYAMSHWVRPCPAAGSASSPGLASVPGDPPPSDSASGDAGLVALARPDYDKLTNGPPLQAAERGNFLWSLIDAGYAVIGD